MLTCIRCIIFLVYYNHNSLPLVPSSPSIRELNGQTKNRHHSPTLAFLYNLIGFKYRYCNLKFRIFFFQIWNEIKDDRFSTSEELSKQISDQRQNGIFQSFLLHLFLILDQMLIPFFNIILCSYALTFHLDLLALFHF